MTDTTPNREESWEKLKKLQEEVEDKSERIGVLKERNRILTEINKIDLPVGAWFLLKPIFNPAPQDKEEGKK